MAKDSTPLDKIIERTQLLIENAEDMLDKSYTLTTRQEWQIRNLRELMTAIRQILLCLQKELSNKKSAGEIPPADP